MPRTLSPPVMDIVLGACAQVDVAPPPSLSDQLAVRRGTVRVATDAVSPRATPSTSDMAASS